MQHTAFRRTPVNLSSSSTASPSCAVLAQATSADGRQVTKFVHPPPVGAEGGTDVGGPYRGSLPVASANGNHNHPAVRAVPNKTVLSLPVPFGVVCSRNVVEPEASARLCVEEDEQSASVMLQMLSEQLNSRALLLQATPGRQQASTSNCGDSSTKRATKVRRVEENMPVEAASTAASTATRRSTSGASTGARPSSGGSVGTDTTSHHHHHHIGRAGVAGNALRMRIAPTFVDQLLREWALPHSRWSALQPLVASPEHRETHVMKALALLVDCKDKDGDAPLTLASAGTAVAVEGVPLDDPVALDDLLKLVAACFPLQSTREGEIVASVLSTVFAALCTTAVQSSSLASVGAVGYAKVLYLWATDPYGNTDAALQATLVQLRMRGAEEELVGVVYTLLEDAASAASGGDASEDNEARPARWCSNSGTSFFHELFLTSVSLIASDASRSAAAAIPATSDLLLNSVRLLVAAASRIPVGSVKMEDQLVVLQCLSTLQRHQGVVVSAFGSTTFAEMCDLLASTLPHGA